MLLAVVMVVGMLTAMASAAEAETTAYWPNFRNSQYNMAITDTETPVSAATTVVKWAVSTGTSWSDTPSGMIIADNALIFMDDNEAWIGWYNLDDVKMWYITDHV